MTPLSSALELITLGFSPIPVPYRSKRPVGSEWQNLRITAETAPNYFGDGPGNIGILLGEPSGGRVDVDVDCAEAAALVGSFLPATRIFGRRGNPTSHFLYSCPDPPEKTRKWVDPIAPKSSKACIIELRSTGAQTIAPGSTHDETGEAIVWENDSPIQELPSSDLAQMVSCVAAGAMLARYFPARGSRHDARLAIAGVLARLGWDEKIAITFLSAVCKTAGCDRNGIDDSRTAVRGTFAKVGRMEPATGWKALEGYYEEKLVQKLKLWMPAFDSQAPPQQSMEDAVPAAERPAAAPSELPLVELSTDQEAATKGALDALRGEKIWVRNHALVEILHGSCDDPKRKIFRPMASPTIRNMPLATLVARMSAKVTFVRKKDGAYVRACVPPYLGSVALAQGSYPQFDDLVGITETPMIRPDGSVVEEPGYDRATGYFYAPNATYPAVPKNPTKSDALESLAKIFELVQDFPFAGPADKSAWLAGLLSPFARPAFSCVPFFVFGANTPSSGKSLLAGMIGQIFLGRSFARCPQVADEDEERKRMTTLLMEGDRLCLMDNYTRLGGTTMETLATGEVWKERVLGASKSSGDLPILMICYVTANNISIVGDMGRRVCMCNLESRVENPEDRSDFKIQDLETYVREHRAELAIACLTILRAYYVAGKPKHGIPNWGSFEAWSGIVRELSLIHI